MAVDPTYPGCQADYSGVGDRACEVAHEHSTGGHRSDERQRGGSVTEAKSRGWFSRTLERLTADGHQIDAEERRAEAASAGCEPVSMCGRGKADTVTGGLKSVVYTPRETVPTPAAQLVDGSRAMTR